MSGLRFYSSESTRPSWLPDAASTLQDISAALPWVHEEQVRWDAEHPLAPNLDANARVREHRVWLLEDPLINARQRLERLGFQMTGPVPVSIPDTVPGQDRELLARVFAAPDHQPYLCHIDEPGFPAHDVDAWHPENASPSTWIGRAKVGPTLPRRPPRS